MGREKTESHQYGTWVYARLARGKEDCLAAWARVRNNWIAYSSCLLVWSYLKPTSLSFVRAAGPLPRRQA